MILVDNRIGSRDLVDERHLPEDVSTLTRLEYGDVCWLGNGPTGAYTVSCGLEIKRISDALDSFKSGRFADQLRGLSSTYSRIYLQIEGVWGYDEYDNLCLAKLSDTYDGKRYWIWTIDTKLKFKAFDNWLTSICERGNVRIKRSLDRKDTAKQIMNLYSWWQKDYESHNSLSSFQSEYEPYQIYEPTLREKVASLLPGVGRKKAPLVAEQFNSVYTMVTAEETSWVQIDGIGKTIARKVVSALRNTQE